MKLPEQNSTDTAGSFSLEGRLILLTGASGHLGRAMAAGLSDAGAEVIACGRSAERLAVLKTGVKGVVETMVFDIKDPQQCSQAGAAMTMRFGRLDGLVNNAYAPSVGVFGMVSAEEFSSSLAEGLTGPFALVQACFPLMKNSYERGLLGGASIVNIASMYGVVSPDPRIYGTSGANNPPQYGATKAGLIQLTRYLACHLAPHGIRCNSISPGPFPNPEALAKDGEFAARLESKIPLGRIGEAREMVGPLVFLCSPASSFVTGTNLTVDGGWTAW